MKISSKINVKLWLEIYNKTKLSLIKKKKKRG